MKARIKKTGEIVSIEDLYDDGTALVNGYYIKVSELDFVENIDWEQQRFEIAKDIYSRNYGNSKVTAKACAKIAVERANILIAELKKGCNDANH